MIRDRFAEVEIVNGEALSVKNAAEIRDRLPLKAFKGDVVHQLELRRFVLIIKYRVGVVVSHQRGDPEQVAGVSDLIAAVLTLNGRFIQTAVAANAIVEIMVIGNVECDVFGGHSEGDGLGILVNSERNILGDILAPFIGDDDSAGQRFVDGGDQRNGIALIILHLIDGKGFAVAVNKEQSSVMHHGISDRNGIVLFQFSKFGNHHDVLGVFRVKRHSVIVIYDGDGIIPVAGFAVCTDGFQNVFVVRHRFKLRRFAGVVGNGNKIPADVEPAAANLHIAGGLAVIVIYKFIGIKY